MKAKLRVILVGGFLGSGKTTAILRLIRWLQRRHFRVAVITNDQAEGLVDTGLMRRATHAVREIPGGCFCCKLDDLADTIMELRGAERPDIILAEPVGSCTDIQATVVKPLLDVYNTEIRVAPFSVLVDPFTAIRVLENDKNDRYSKEVDYVITKQMEEAENLVLNKTDLLPVERTTELKKLLEQRYPTCRIRSISARTGRGCDAWFTSLLDKSAKCPASLAIDYKRYAAGERKLGWLNSRAVVSGHSTDRFDSLLVMKRFAESLSRRLGRERALIAHFKAALTNATDTEGGQTSDQELYCLAQITNSAAPMSIWSKRNSHLAKAILTINIRAQSDPNRLQKVLASALNDVSKLAKVEVQKTVSFRPAPPNPLRRIA